MNEQAIQNLSKDLETANKILVIQAENPDGDSLGSAMALEQILGEMGKQVILYCPVSMPKYLRYIDGWDRVTSDFPNNFDLAIIVDASTKSVLAKAVTGEKGAKLSSKPVYIMDHHDVGPDLDFRTNDIIDSSAVAASQVIYDVATAIGWKLDKASGSAITAAIMSDSLGLISRKTSAKTIKIVAEMVEKYEVSLSDLDDARREVGKKTKVILRYKGKLLERVKYVNDGKVAVLTIPYSEITEFSDQYNPSQLVLEELRMVEDVDLAIAFKTYPDRITGKLRAFTRKGEICHKIAEEFGGGGHPFAAGFKIFDKNHEKIQEQVLQSITKHLEES